ncbi:thioesterase II family protein [Actinoplanes sp. HUAS TT8]|uniref:thioesterase II family protein n=1 Tax=Actinoplanes sp. HUAS TT8 TaxID=3447453 RepID=UPI003F525F48
MSVALPAALIAFKPKSVDNPALVCFPWAGAGAAPFRSWAPVLSSTAAIYGVRLPGRESRIDEPLVDDVSCLVKGVISDIEGLGDRPVVLFGLCSGALLAYEAARLLGPRVSRLVVASQLPPPAAARAAAEELAAPESSARKYLTDGVAGDPEMREMALQILESDIRAVTGYQYLPGHVDAPISVFHGAGDTEVEIGEMNGWIREGGPGSIIHDVPDADHMFSGPAWITLAELIAAELN